MLTTLVLFQLKLPQVDALAIMPFVAILYTIAVSLLALLGVAPTTLMLCVTMHFVLAALGLRRKLAYASTGLIVGCIMAYASGFDRYWGSPEWDALSGLAVGAAVGLSGGLAFWTAMRPDLFHAARPTGGASDLRVSHR